MLLGRPYLRCPCGQGRPPVSETPGGAGQIVPSRRSGVREFGCFRPRPIEVDPLAGGWNAEWGLFGQMTFSSATVTNGPDDTGSPGSSWGSRGSKSERRDRAVGSLTRTPCRHGHAAGHWCPWHIGTQTPVRVGVWCLSEVDGVGPSGAEVKLQSSSTMRFHRRAAPGWERS